MESGKKCLLEDLCQEMVRLRLGDIIPADVKLVEGDYLLTDESALTGESLPVEKHLSDVGYASSIVRQGEMNTLVVNTGMRTYFGKTAKLVEEVKTQSHFQKAIVKIGDYLIFLAIGLVIIIFLVSIFSRPKRTGHNPVCISLDCCGNTRSASSSPLSHHGNRCHSPCQEGSDCEQAGSHRRDGGDGCTVLRQDWHYYEERAHYRRNKTLCQIHRE